MSVETEWAWATALFEGEGCIHLSDDGKNRALVLRTTDPDVLERFAAIVGAGTIRGPLPTARAHHKPSWEWRLTRWTERQRILERMLPMLGERRRAAAEAMLAVPTTYGRNVDTCRAGLHPWTPDNIAGRTGGTAVTCRSTCGS